MIPRIVKLEEKMLIGQNMKMSLIENKTGFLWGQFSPRLKEIPNRASEDKISMQVYPPMYHNNFIQIKNLKNGQQLKFMILKIFLME